MGVNIDVEGSAPCSMFAEYSAIGAMITSGERKIQSIVATSKRRALKHLSPCERCRELIRNFGDPYVIMDGDEGVPRKIRISKLIPFPI